MRLPSGLAESSSRGEAPTEIDEGVGLDAIEVRATGAGGDDDRGRALETTVAGEDADTGLQQGVAHILRLLAGESQEALVHRGQVDGDLRLERLSVLALRVELHAQVARLGDRDGGVCRGDQALRGNDVGQHRGTADADALHQGHLGSELSGCESRLVTAGTAAENGDALSALECGGRHASHSSAILARKPAAS